MKITHLIPRDGLGGVEQAARSLDPNSELDIEVVFLSGKSLSNKPYIKILPQTKQLNSLGFYLNGLKYLLKSKPNLLISSLWRSSVISIPYVAYRKIIRKDKFKFVIFIHANKFAHVLDKVITMTAIKFADEVWCDSLASKDFIFKFTHQENKLKIISFLVNVYDIHQEISSRKNNNFVFWGRIAKQKRLDKAIKLFEQINNKLPESLFYIYGPDCGELSNLKNLVKELSLSEKVFFMGEKKPNHYPTEAVESKFFINTSSHEGMAIAVVEAMQLGLVPIITPVGEIANYCTDKINSIYYSDQAFEEVLNLIENDTSYTELSTNAQNYWNEKIDYSMDFNKNCLRIISGV